MPDDPINLVRIQETEASIQRLGKLVGEWADRRFAKDTKKQYGAILTALRTQLCGLISEVKLSFASIHPSAGRGAVYAACRLEEKRLLWIERLWVYFRDKFDQRDDPTLQDVLAAADEVVWSCYEAPFRATGRAHGASPLPYLAAEYSPRALARKDVPQDLRSDVDSAFFSKMLQELPLPIVSLPPVCVGEPWWLIYLAHEVGHHAQFDLLPGQKLVDDFRDLVASVIPDSETAERWRFRGEEIFADSFSLYMTGSWALWALTELEWTNETGMFNDGNPRYPSPGARLWLMAKVLNLLQLDGSAALRGFPEGSVFAAEGDQPRIVGDLAKAIHGSPIIGGKTFAQICDWRLEDHLGADAPVREWKQTFLKEEGGGMTPEQTLRAARIALSGGVAAWAAISADSDVQRRSDRKEQLAKDLLSALRDSHEPVERGAEDEPALTNIKSQALISTLFHSDPVELGVW